MTTTGEHEERNAQILNAHHDGALTRLDDHLKTFAQLFPILFREEIQTLRVKIDYAIARALWLDKKQGG